MEERNRKKDIAIIGLSGKFHGSDDLYEFWNNLKEGKELLHFYSDLEMKEAGVSDQTLIDPDFVKAGSFINDPDAFDHEFFGYSKDEAELMDPQIRVLHEQIWAGLENANCIPENYKNKIGLYVAASDNLNWRAHALFADNENVNPFLQSHISDKNFISTLISYKMDLKGPSYYVDTACSSSLVAAHMASRSLLMKECGVAVVGGVRISTSDSLGYFYQEGMIASKDGHCKTFDQDASGIIAGEGVGVVVLKRYEDAIAEGDFIHAVIRSTAVNNDGNRKTGYTAPSISGQYDCINLAHRIANVKPQDISYIEAHGTATRLGDPIEIEALNKAFGYDNNHQCYIGSVKSNVGHLDAAAGVAGLIKTTLALKNKELPPSLHYTAPNPEIDFKSGPFKVVDHLTAWNSTKPLVAGVSSFGIGGTNAHVVVEEAKNERKSDEGRAYQLLNLSAVTDTALNAYCSKLKTYVESNSGMNLVDLAYSAMVGRKEFEARRSIVFSDAESLLARLSGLGTHPVKKARNNNYPVFLFPGQGSQFYGMAKELYISEPKFREIVDKGLMLLRQTATFNYKAILGFSDNSNGDEKEINNTKFTQPLLFLVEYAYAHLLAEWGIHPKLMIGHSLGEYSAACLSGVIDFEDALRLVQKRGELMSNMEAGAMLFVQMEAVVLEAELPDDLSVAAINSPDTCVISGPTKSIELLKDKLDEKAIVNSLLKTSHAFHSAMMHDMLEDYKSELKKVKLSEPKIPFISNVTGQKITVQEATSVDYWMKQLTGTVRFSDGLKLAMSNEGTVCIEVGPGRSLSNMVKSEAFGTTKVESVFTGNHQRNETSDLSVILEAVGYLWELGINVDWSAFYRNQNRNKIPFPTYAFDKNRFSTRVDPFKDFSNLSSLHESSTNPADWFFKELWKETTSESLLKRRSVDVLMVFDHQFDADWPCSFIDFRQQINVGIGDKFQQKSETDFVINPKNKVDYQKLFEFVPESTESLQIIHAWNVSKSDNTGRYCGHFSLTFLGQTLLTKENFKETYLDFITCQTFQVLGNERIDPYKSMAVAALKVLPKEIENLKTTCVEVPLDSNRSEWPEFLNIAKDNSIIAIRGDKTWTPTYEAMRIPEYGSAETLWKENGVYLITGAGGGIAKAIIESGRLVEGVRLLLVGRSEPNDYLKSLSESDNIEFIKDDLSNETELKNKIKPFLETFRGKITGVFHTAGLADYAGLIKDRNEEDCQVIFKPKVEGSLNLLNALKNDISDFFLMCSSSTAVLAPFGQVGYTAANLFQNALAKSNDFDFKLLSIMWTAWKEQGMTVSAIEKNNGSLAQLSGKVSNADGLRIMDIALKLKEKNPIISTGDFNVELNLAKETVSEVISAIEQEGEHAEVTNIRHQLSVEYEAPTNSVESRLCEIWISFSGYDRIGINDNFFELGGDSLRAITLLAKLKKEFSLILSITDFYQNPTIKALALEIEMAGKIEKMSTSPSSTKSENTIKI